MASFTPGVPEQQAPIFLNWSRPIQQPEADKSKGIALTGYGDALKLGVSAVDDTIKSSIDQSAHASIDPIRDDFTNTLKSAQNALINPPTDVTTNAPTTPSLSQTGTSATNAGDGQTLLNPGPGSAQGSVPLPLERGLNGIETMQAALAGGKVSESAYLDRLSAATKDLRDTYGPGYRDYIDQRVSAITGVIPANAYIKSIISDLNLVGSTAKAEREKYVSMGIDMVKDGVPGAAQWLNNFQNNRISQESFATYANNAMAYKYNFAGQKAALENEKLSNEVDKTRATPLLNQHLDFLTNAAFQGNFTAAGQLSPQQVVDHLQKIVANQEPADQGALTKWSQDLTLQRNQVKQQFITAANAHKPGEKSLSDRVGGPEEVEKMAEARLKIFDNTISAIGSGNYPLALTNAQQMNAKVDAASAEVFNDKDMQDYIVHSKVAKDMFPEKFSQDYFMQYGLNPNIMQKFKAPFANAALKISTQAQPQPGGAAYTFDKALNELKLKGVNDPNAYDKLLGMITLLNRPDTPAQVKNNIADAAFSPANNNFLDNANFKKDYYDPTQQRNIPGKYAAFVRMTSPDITKTMASKDMDPNRAQNYRNWAEETFGQKLFQNELGDINDTVSNKIIHVSWDNENHRFGLLDMDNKPLGRGVAPQLQQRIFNLNMGLRSLGNVEDAFGGNINAYLLNVLKTSGVDLSKGIQGIPEQMVQAILKSRGPQKMEDTFDPYGNRNKSKGQDRVYPGTLNNPQAQ